MDEKLCGGEPPEIPSVWSLWVSNGTWGSNHMLNRLFGSLVLASGGQSSDPAWPADKGRAMTTIGMRFFSPPMESPALNRVWLPELRSTPILRVRTHKGQGSAASDAGCGKWRARCPHNLPTALSPTMPLNLPEGQTTSPGMTGWERLYGWEKWKKSRHEGRWAGCTTGIDKDVGERNEEILTCTYCTLNVQHTLWRGQSICAAWVLQPCGTPKVGWM